MRRTAGILMGTFLASLPLAAATLQTPPQNPPLTFKAGADAVAMTVVVRKRNGKPVTDLKREDFQLIDNGQARPIVDFRSEPTPVRIALLADFSGSMDVAEKRPAARQVADQVVSWLTPGVDQVGLFAFDTKLHEVESIGPAPGTVLEKLSNLKPYGSTSLYDAIAQTSKLISTDNPAHRAVVALTDGADNASRMTPEEVSAIASQIDVPVYIIIVVSPLDRAGRTSVNEPTLDALISGRLGDLARWTGGGIYLSTTPAMTSQAAQEIVSDLRHQYFMSFEPDVRPGWHPIEVKTRQKDLVVRARSGYLARSVPEPFQR
jgi:VWFA-related protein